MSMLWRSVELPKVSGARFSAPEDIDTLEKDVPSYLYRYQRKHLNLLREAKNLLKTWAYFATVLGWSLPSSTVLRSSKFFKVEMGVLRVVELLTLAAIRTAGNSCLGATVKQ